MYCPECGSDAADAKYCPECGTQLEGVRSAVKGGAKTTGSARKATSGGGRAAARQAPAKESGAQAAARPRSTGTNPAYLWGAIGLIALVVVVAVVITQRSSEPSTTAATATAAPPLSAVDTSGSYEELVAAGNTYFDTGSPLISSKQIDVAAPWFAAAAKAYAAAWKKKPGDPAVGTDYATSIFYSATGPQDVEAAIRQVDKVIAKNPDFQNARFNKGNYLAMLARMTEQGGDKAQATKLFAQAKAEYQAAIAIDATSQSGQAAAEALKTL
jgi:hypothetical protein